MAASTRGHPSRLAVKNGEHLRMTAEYFATTALEVTIELIIREPRGLTFTGTDVISTAPGTSGLLALGLEKADDGIDTIERWAG
jgi:hypothetical protein